MTTRNEVSVEANADFMFPPEAGTVSLVDIGVKPNGRNQTPSDFFGAQLPCLILQHHGNIVLDRIGQLAGLADQFESGLAVLQRPLADGANEYFKQTGVHSASPEQMRQDRGLPRPSRATPRLAEARKVGPILRHPFPSSE